jgi:hypothetical protein
MLMLNVCSTLPSIYDYYFSGIGTTTTLCRAGIPDNLPIYKFDILGEEQVYRRYLTMYNRRVQLPAIHDKAVRQTILVSINIEHGITQSFCL